MRFLRIAALLVAATLAACTTKPTAPTQAEWDAVSAADFNCQPGSFVDADLDSVLHAPASYYEKCVRIRGLLSPIVLTKNAISSAGIGIYAKDDKLLAAVATHSQFAFVSGRLRSCADRAARLQALAARASQAGAPVSGDRAALSGFCKLNPGPALYVNEIIVIPTAMD